MSYKSFDYFGEIATTLEDPFFISGRNGTDEKALPRIASDIIFKLDLQRDDRLLEIGCGCCELLRNIKEKLCWSNIDLTGIDHKNFRRWIPDYADFAPGNFLNMDVAEFNKFDKVLIYSVIHYLKDMNEVYDFITKAFNLLKSWGLLLVGDIPNRSLKSAFLKSEKYKEYIIEDSSPYIEDPYDCVEFDNGIMQELVFDFRATGANAWLLPQPKDLSCGYTREDILIERIS